MGRGFPIFSSTKQKINTKISTDTEFVGVDDFMPVMCWNRYFIAAQGCNVNNNRLHQYKKSSIILNKTGKALISKITKHINIGYFYITNRVKNGKVSVVWYPTGDVIGDHMNNPLQGAMFRNFIDQIILLILAAYMGP